MPSNLPETVLIPQLESRATARLLDVFYPSGQRQQFKGVYRGPWGMATGEIFVMVSVPSSDQAGARTGVFDEVMGLDPLCVIVDNASAGVIFEPGMVSGDPSFPAVLREKLLKYPNWPQLLEFSKDEDGHLSML